MGGILLGGWSIANRTVQTYRLPQSEPEPAIGFTEWTFHKWSPGDLAQSIPRLVLWSLLERCATV